MSQFKIRFKPINACLQIHWNSPEFNPHLGLILATIKALYNGFQISKSGDDIYIYFFKYVDEIKNIHES